MGNGVNKSLVGDGESSPIQHRLPWELVHTHELEKVRTCRLKGLRRIRTKSIL